MKEDGDSHFESVLLNSSSKQFSIIEVEAGNASLTRGAFGEISLALQHLPCVDEGCGNTEHNEKSDLIKRKRIQVVVIKTILQAFKIVKHDSESNHDQECIQLSPQVASEIMALKSLSSHPNITSMIACYPSQQKATRALCMVFDYCPVDLQFALDWRRVTFCPLLSFDLIRSVFRDLIAALRHCHSRGWVHGDVKPGNLLVSNTGHIQLCDFGLARSMHSACDTNDGIGAPVKAVGLCTLYYRSPEVLLGECTTKPYIDMYSSGTVLAELVLGRPLFIGRNDLDQLSTIFATLGTPSDSNWPDACDLPDYGKITFSEQSPRPITSLIPRAAESDHLITLLDLLLALDPKQRITSAQAELHPWLSSDSAHMASRARLVTDLVPDELHEPLILSPMGTSVLGYSVAQRQILALAATRRTLLSNLTQCLT